MGVGQGILCRSLPYIQIGLACARSLGQNRRARTPRNGNIGAQRKESEDMIKLHQGQRWRNLPNLSPPCVKLETWLRMAAIPYESAPPDLAEAPKGKVPFIEDAGVKMGDSTLIVEYLKRTYGK